MRIKTGSKSSETASLDIEEITNQIVSLSGKLSSAEKASTGRSYELGRKLNELAVALKSQKITMKIYVRDNFPWLTVKSIRNYRKIGSMPELADHPQLFVLGTDRLLNLKRLIGKSNSLKNFLIDNQISYDFEPEDKEASKGFKICIDIIIEKNITYNHKIKVADQRYKNLSTKTEKMLESVTQILIDPKPVNDGERVFLENSITNINETLTKLREIHLTP
jgi:hypothetical protein